MLYRDLNRVQSLGSGSIVLQLIPEACKDQNYATALRYSSGNGVWFLCDVARRSISKYHPTGLL